MIDLDIKKLINELYEFLNPKVIDRIKSHLLSLYRKIEDLGLSRDNWRDKYEKIKKEKINSLD